jgi:hypothetical protein
MHPFRDGDTFATFRNLVDTVVSEINSLDNNYVLKASQSELEEHFVDKVLIEPLVLHTENRYIKNQSGTKIDIGRDFRRGLYPDEKVIVQGTKIDIAIPFEGDSDLWKIRASSFSLSGYPEIDVRNNEIIFSISFPDDSAESNRLLAEIDRNTKSLSEAVGYLKNDVTNHNNSAPNTIKQAIARKRTLAHAWVKNQHLLSLPKEERSHMFSLPLQRESTNLNLFWKRRNINTY